MTSPRVVIIGAGIGGASLAWHLGNRAQVTLVEAEATPGYHTTGRSAAFFAETYGGPMVQPLTTGSRDFFFNPPAGFASTPLVAPRGALHVATQDRVALAEQVAQSFRAMTPSVEVVGPERIRALAPMLRPGWGQAAVWEPQCQDIDTAGLHAAFLAGARRAGSQMLSGAPVTALERKAGGWQIQAGPHQLEADIIVNAAGAWGDAVACMAGVSPVGLVPMRRTILTFDPGDAPLPAGTPLVLDIEELFYFKPSAGQVWASPADETPSPPCDAQPDELDKAIAIDRIEAATLFKVRRIGQSWAGLRTFAPDRAPVYGFDPAKQGFFWCVGQGGFGIQTAPAAGALAAALLLGDPVPDHLARLGVTADRYGVTRLR